MEFKINDIIMKKKQNKNNKPIFWEIRDINNGGYLVFCEEINKMYLLDKNLIKKNYVKVDNI